MNHLTVFYFALPTRTFNELGGITHNPQMELKSIHKEEDVVLGCLYMRPTENDCLGRMINDVYKAKPTYHLKSNSINFNITELPFQTYISFLTETDVDNLLPTFPELRSYTGFSTHVENVLNHYPTKDIKELLIYTLNMMLGGSFDSDKLYNALTSLQVEIEDLSRIYNHMVIIAMLIRNETIMTFLDVTLAKIRLNERIEDLRLVKI